MPQSTTRFVQLGFRVAHAATFHGRDLAMLKTVDIMKEEEISIAGRKSSQSAFEGHAVHNARLSPIASSKTPSKVFLRDVCHQLIE